MLVPNNAKIYLYTPPTDMRKSIDMLCVLIVDVLKMNPAEGCLFLFRSRTGNNTKRCIINKIVLRCGAVEVNALVTTELYSPKGEQPIGWFFITSLPIGNARAAKLILQYYLRRWQIEVFFRIYKSGCRVEQLQLTNAERMGPCLALYLIIAWRILHMTLLSRRYPHVSCEVIFSAQAVEAINHARAAQVPIIVAVNKIDKSDADQDRVKNELATQNLIPKEWGGDTTFVPISAKTDEGIDTLLDSILVQAEILELDAMLDCSARGIVIESRLDKGRCVVASVLVQQSVRVSPVPVPGLVRVLVNNRLVGIGEALADGHVAPKRLFY